MFVCDTLKVSLNGENLLDISFAIKDSLALVGESGSGKSLTLKSLLDLTPRKMNVTKKLSADFSIKNGESVAFVPQNPFTALSPLTKIKKQFFKSDIKKRLRQVGLDDKLADRYPPELSGGQLQRVLIAMAIDEKTKLLLLDEPTTALDTKTKTNILELLLQLKNTYAFKTLFVSHDIKSASMLSNEVAVIKKGKIVEEGNMEDFLHAPKTGYGQELINSNFANRNFRQ